LERKREKRRRRRRRRRRGWGESGATGVLRSRLIADNISPIGYTQLEATM